MKKTIYVMAAMLAISVLISGCATKKKCNAKYPCVTQEKEILIYKDSLRIDSVYLFTVADTVTITAPAPCDTFTIVSENNKRKIRVSVSKKGIISVDCISKADSLLKVIAGKDTIIRGLKEMIVTEEKIVYKMSAKQLLWSIGISIFVFLTGLFIGFVKK